MNDKMLALVCWNLMFFMLLCWKIIYILEKLLGNILLLRKNAVKTFTESCNNPVELDKQMVEYRPIYLYLEIIEPSQIVAYHPAYIIGSLEKHGLIYRLLT